MNWELHGSDGHFEIQDMDESRRVALVRFATLGEARLMAAAPKLLEAARKAVHLMRLLPSEIECETECNALQAAIAETERWES